MHYRNNKLKFQTSKEVKKELQNLNGTYTESMDMYKIIKIQQIMQEVLLILLSSKLLEIMKIY